MLIKAWQNWLGANLQLEPKRLNEGVGVDASNLRLGSADLRPWGAADVVHTLDGAPAGQRITIYRLDRDTISDTSSWLSSVNDLDFVRSLVADDTTDRTYYTGEAQPRVTNTSLALSSPPYPNSWRTLGVPAPTVQMTAVVAAAGTGPVETRVYTDTFVTDVGEQSAPNPNTVSIAVPGGSTVNLVGMGLPAIGPNGINRRRIYVSANGDLFKLVLEQSSSLTTATDSLLPRGEALITGGDVSIPAWLEPPAGLRGLIELWNGMVGGFLPKAYLSCEVSGGSRPWAWPLEYRYPVADNIVGTGAWLQNWLLLTTGKPRIVTGSSPASLNDRLINFPQACVSKRSIVSMGHGVVWASNDGLCYVGEYGTKMLTDGIITPKAWEVQVAPSTIIGTQYQGLYVGFFTQGGVRKGFMIDPRAPSGLIWLTQGAFGAWHDPLSQRTYLVDTGNVIRRWDSGAPLTVGFTTGTVRHPYQTNPGAVRVVAHAGAFPVTFALWGDEVLRASMTITDGDPWTLPDGYVAQDFRVSVQAAGPVQAVLLGESPVDVQ